MKISMLTIMTVMTMVVISLFVASVYWAAEDLYEGFRGFPGNCMMAAVFLVFLVLLMTLFVTSTLVWILKRNTPSQELLDALLTACVQAHKCIESDEIRLDEASALTTEDTEGIEAALKLLRQAFALALRQQMDVSAAVMHHCG